MAEIKTRINKFNKQAGYMGLSYNKFNKQAGYFTTLFLIAVLIGLLFFLAKTQLQINFMRNLMENNSLLQNYNTEEHVEIIEIRAPFLKDNFSSVSELHWTHLPVSYAIVDCEKEKLPEKYRDFDYVSHTRLAFDIISNLTDGIIKFEEAQSQEQNPDIKIRCNISKWGIEVEGNGIEKIFIAGNTELVYSENKIINATIDLFRPYKCPKNPITQIHEILHGFGIPHAPKTGDYVLDMMYPFQTSCYAKVSQETIDKLKRLYSK